MNGNIYIIGDTHSYKEMYKILDINHLSKNDFVIVAGDFGLILPDLQFSLFEALNQKEFTTLFVDGNHEGFEVLNSYPIDIWNGGKVHKISDKIIHLMRGQVFEILGKKIFTFGGAETIGKERSIIGIDWFKEEIPNYQEMDEGISNLEKHNNKVDYIITHTCRTYTLHYLCLTNDFSPYPDCLSEYLEYINDIVEYNHWYFGHFHLDIENVATDKETAIYNKLIKLL